MMWRNQLVFSFMLMVAAAQNAMAQDAPFEAETVGIFLASCDSDVSQCGLSYGWRFEQAQHERRDFGLYQGRPHSGPVIAWLKAHPETRAMATEDGIDAAYKSLYPCP